jgi:hypothetical protein
MSFLRQVRDLAETESRPPYTEPYGNNPTRWQASQAQRDDPGYVLPVRAVADDLMGIYWREIHIIFPFVHRPSFEAQYHSVWTGEGLLPPRMFHVSLNVIFALCCYMSPALAPKVRTASANSYYERARQLLQIDVTEPGTLETIQTLLLLAQYLQTVNNQSRCWAVLGIAIRTAQALGLEQESSRTSFSTQCEKEMFRRVWHGCVLLER